MGGAHAQQQALHGLARPWRSVAVGRGQALLLMTLAMPLTVTARLRSMIAYQPLQTLPARLCKCKPELHHVTYIQSAQLLQATSRRSSSRQPPCFASCTTHMNPDQPGSKRRRWRVSALDLNARKMFESIDAAGKVRCFDEQQSGGAQLRCRSVMA